MKINEKIKRALRTAAATLTACALAFTMCVDISALRPASEPKTKPTSKPKLKPAFTKPTTTKPTIKPATKPTIKPGQKPANPKSKAVEKFTVNGVTFEMVRVEGGPFQMGSGKGYGDEKKARTDTLYTFYIGRTEVTQALWEAIMDENPSNFKGATRPVECVSKDDCNEFIERLNRKTGRHFRIPLEIEWEYAARGGNRSRNYMFSGSNNLNRVGWYENNSGSTTHPVGQKLDNELGLYDMSGNVNEWCEFYPNVDIEELDDHEFFNFLGAMTYYYYRGGAWNSSATDCAVTDRFSCERFYCSSTIGLRLAL